MRGMNEIHIVVTLALNPHNANILSAGTTGGVYRTADGASSWHKVNNGLVPAEILDAALSMPVNILQVDPVNPDTVYAGTTKGLFKTTNQADAWFRIGESLPDQFISSLALDPTNPQIVYVTGQAGIYKSMDGGNTWKASHQELTALNVRTIVISPCDSQTLYAGTNGSGLYRSADGGASWAPVPLNTRPVAAGAIR